LGPDLHGALLDWAVTGQGRFVASQVQGADGLVHNAGVRQSWRCDEGLGRLKAEFRASIDAAFDQLREQLGIPPFAVFRTELELAAHRDGSFYKPHVDTHFGVGRASTEGDRMLTLVYYFHRQPRGFSGGEIALYPYNREARTLIEPFDNRLVAFPAHTLHEVCPVMVPGDAWEDARFAINCWFNRERPGIA
ncbi:MAG TPA: 2OG-Fe(II) oxygenase, partial [Novosphingobium sp.]|nr:2OG-Fe(II) oxygenase [Novosphingobium sp.]